MPTYKYQASLPNGVSIFGLFDAESVDGLTGWLRAKNLTLISATELAVNSALAEPVRELPRLLQLRIGERLREALLTAMPAHVAVRAMADEPLEHPALMMMPWLLCSTVSVSAGLLLLTIVLPDSRAALWAAAGALPLTAVVLWGLAWQFLVLRPKALLHRMADRLEAGEPSEILNRGMLPVELRAVLEADLNSQTKSCCAAEIVQTIAGVRLETHQFAARILGPVATASLVMFAMYLLSYFITPQFEEIFTGFGISIPGLTEVVFRFGHLAQALGGIGLWSAFGLMCLVLVAFYLLLVWNRTAEFVESVPILGLSLNWLTQSRIARVLGILIRNRTPPDEALQIATRASGHSLDSRVVHDGFLFAKSLKEGSPASGGSLSGLPLATLARLDSGSDEGDRQSVHQAFENYARALEQAASGNGWLFVVVLEMLTIVVAGGIVGMYLIAVFLPLIKLINDLSCVVGLPLILAGGG